MPFTTLSSDGLSIVCLLVDHDWTAQFSISHFFPGDVTAGLSDRENRTPEAEAILLTAAASITTDTDDAQALRQTLATIGKGWFGLPIWGDQFLGANAAVAGARTYAPQRLIDLTAVAIVDAASTLTADHTYAPLLVGHITALPKIQPINGTMATCSFTLTEDSPWTFRFGSIVTVAAGTWPSALLPDWTTSPTQTPVSGLQYQRIGQQREQTMADEERAFRWTADAMFTLCDRGEVATLLAFFIASRGLWTPFDASLWWTPGTPSAEAPNSTKVRFGTNVLKIDFQSGQVASAQINFMQVPWEITGTAGETPQQAARVFLYQFTYDVPGPVVYRFTNCWRPLTRSSDGTYDPAPMEHVAIQGGLDLTAEQVTLNSFIFDGNPLDLFNPNILEGKMWLRIYEIQTDPIDTSAAVLRWFGSVAAAPQTGRKYTADCQWLGGLLDREIPNVRIGPRCNTFMFSRPCGHLKSAFLKTGTLFSSTGNVVVVAASDSAAANTYSPGKIEVGSGLTYESRLVVASVAVSGGQQLTLDQPLRQAAASQAVNYFRYCDRAMATCQALDSTGWRGRFRGHPFVPQVNFSLPQMSNTAASGKK